MGHLHWFFNQLALMQWDAVRCSRILNNAVHNAVLHSPKARRFRLTSTVCRFSSMSTSFVQD
jgi:hypothetical protein